LSKIQTFTSESNSRKNQHRAASGLALISKLQEQSHFSELDKKKKGKGQNRIDLEKLTIRCNEIKKTKCMSSCITYTKAHTYISTRHACMCMYLCVCVRERERERESHTYPLDIVVLSNVAIHPVQYVQCSIRTAVR
jgi:hypothetical protein